VVFREEVHSEDESRICGGSRCSSKIRSASGASFPAPLCDTAHTLPGDIPTSPCSPLYPPQSTSESGYILSVSTAPPPVTFCMARYVSMQSDVVSSKIAAILSPPCTNNSAPDAHGSAPLLQPPPAPRPHPPP